MDNNEQKTILLVEDEALIAMAESQEIKNFGYNVIITSSGRESIEIIEENKEIDMILMDIDLGSGMAGTEAAKEILKNHNIPIIFLTSHSEIEYINKVKEITRYGYVIKNSCNFVLQSSIEMAFELFNKHCELEKTNENLKSLINNTPDFIYSFDLESRHTAVNLSVCKALGLKENDIVGKNHAELGFPKEIVKEWQELHKKVIKTGQIVTTETLTPMPDGTIHYYEVILIPIIDKNRIIGIRGTSRDITEKVNMMTNLRNKEEKFHVTFENAGLAIMLLENDRPLMVNPEYKRLLGYSENELKNKTVDEITHPDDIKKESELAKKLLNGQINRFQIEKRYIHKNGKTVHGLLTVSKNKENKYGVAIIQDITKQKQTEKKLKESEEKYRSVIRDSLDGFLVCSLDGKILEVNNAYCKMVGYSNNELINMKVSEVEFIESEEQVIKHINNVINNGFDRFESKHIRKDGKIINVECSVRFSKELNVLFTFIKNITESKKNEEKITDLALFPEENDNPVFRVSNDAKLLYINSSGRKLVNSQLVGIGDYIPNDWIGLIKSIWKSGESKDYQIEINGRIIHFYAKPIMNKGYINIYANDITDKIRADEQLKNMLSQNKILLRELQHRAKNSFAMISSMIKLSGNSYTSNDIKSAFNDLDSRIKAISKMYELLYSTDSVSKVPFDKYLELISSSVPVTSNNINIEKKFNPIIMSVKKAIPLGIIVAELLTNSIKHAFPDTKKGTVFISLKKINDNVVIEVKDNGIGIQHDFDISTCDSFGLKLIYALTNQINGSFKIEKKDGTRCVLKMPIKISN